MKENTSSKHKRYTRNGANRISSLTRVSYTCFRAFELVLCTLATRDIVYWDHTDLNLTMFRGICFIYVLFQIQFRTLHYQGQ